MNCDVKRYHGCLHKFMFNYMNYYLRTVMLNVIMGVYISLCLTIYELLFENCYVKRYHGCLQYIWLVVCRPQISIHWLNLLVKKRGCC